MTEAGLVRLIARWLKRQPGFTHLARGMGDDCATVRTSPRTLLTCDAFVERVHFRRNWTTARGAGWKALAANVSDIAAAGGTPRATLVSLELPRSFPVAWLKGFYAGLLACARRYGVAVAGGNLSASSHFASHITLSGGAPRRRIGRDGARPGDLVAVTGALGGAKAGLDCLRRGLRGADAAHAIARHRWPQPRVETGRALARFASAMADISDGLARDAGHIAAESRVGIALVPGAVPVHPAARALAGRLGTDPARLALTGGEEYELVAAIPRRRWLAARRAVGRTGITLTPVGECRAGRGVRIAGGVRAAGFDHFA